jgi:transcriptional regulator with XRE-family HTH domain
MSELPVWEQRAYQRMTAAWRDDASLIVRFANGDEVAVDPRRLVRDAAEAMWELMKVSASELLVPVASGGEEAISWFDVRAASDAAFATYLAQAADDEAARVGRRLRAMRERRGMSGRQVAELAGISPVSLSRIEHGHHDVVYRTLQRLLAAMNFTLNDLATFSAPVEPETARKRLKEVGLPRTVIDRILEHGKASGEIVASRIQRIFGWSADDLVGPGDLVLRPTALPLRFKATAAQSPESAAYSQWVLSVARLADEALEREPADVPDNPLAIREEIVDQYGGVRFETLLGWCWGHGVAVVPLDDPGAFHGACLSSEGRPTVVLKQRTSSTSHTKSLTSPGICRPTARLSRRVRSACVPPTTTSRRPTTLPGSCCSATRTRLPISSSATRRETFAG